MEDGRNQCSWEGAQPSPLKPKTAMPQDQGGFLQKNRKRKKKRKKKGKSIFVPKNILPKDSKRILAITQIL